MKTDKLFKLILFSCGVFIIVLAFGILLSLFKGSLPAIKAFGIKFVAGKVWDPSGEKFGMLPFIAGTFITSIIAIAISIPFSIAISILLGVYYKEGFIHKILSYTSDLLAGVPSVIYGFWALYFLVPIIRKLEMKAGIIPYGVGIFTSSIVLSIMIIPYTSSIAREVIKMVPFDIIEGAYSLGATTYEVIKKIIIPYAKSGIFAGILLSFGRAFGETMAVTMVIGNSNSMPKNLFGLGNTMASLIANEFTEATKNIHLSALIYVGFWLFVFSFFINYLGNMVIKKMAIRTQK